MWSNFYTTLTFIIRQKHLLWVSNKVRTGIYLESGESMLRIFQYQDSSREGLRRRQDQYCPGHSSAGDTSSSLLHCSPGISPPRQEISGEEQRNKGTDVNPLHQVNISIKLNRTRLIYWKEKEFGGKTSFFGWDMLPILGKNLLGKIRNSC